MQKLGDSFGLAHIVNRLPNGAVALDELALCVDPSGVFLAGPTPGEPPSGLTFHAPAANRDFVVTRSQPGLDCTILIAAAADVPAIGIGPETPLQQGLSWRAEPIDARLIIQAGSQAPVPHAPAPFPNPAASVPNAPVPLSLREEKCQLRWSRNGGRLQGELLGHQELAPFDFAFVLDLHGRLVATVFQDRVGARLATFEDIQFQLKSYLDGRTDDLNRFSPQVAATAAGPGPHPLSTRLSAVLPALARFDMEPNTSGTGAVCIDPSGYFLTTQYVAQGHGLEMQHHIHVRSTEGKLQQYDADFVSSDGGSGLTLFKIKTPALLPFVPVGEIAGRSGAMWATAVAINPSASYRATGFADYAVSRGQLSWSWKAQPSISRTTFTGVLLGGAVLDDAGQLVGFARFGQPPNAMGVVLASSVAAVFKKPILTCCFSDSIDREAVAKQADFEFRTLGVEQGHTAEVQFVFSPDTPQQQIERLEQIEPRRFRVHLSSLAGTFGASDSIRWRAELRVDGSTVDTRSGAINITSRTVPAPTNVASKVETPDSEFSTIHHFKLKGNVAGRAVVGGNGRYLLVPYFDMGTRRVMVLDLTNLTKREVVVTDIQAPIVAGAEKFVVCGHGVIERWDLATLKKEKSVHSEIAMSALSAAMGSGSAGPIIIRDREGLHIYDLQSLERTDDEAGDRLADVDILSSPSITADGSTITFLGRDRSIRVGKIDQGKIVSWKSFPAAKAQFAVVDPDGHRIFTGVGPVLSIDGATLAPSGAVPATTAVLLPAMDSADVCIAPTRDSVSGNVQAELFDSATQVSLSRTSLNMRIMPGNFFLSAAHDHVASILTAQQTVEVWDVDVADTIAHAKRDYFYLRSPMTHFAHPGTDYHDVPNVRSSVKGNIRFSLVKGPAEMKVLMNGQVNWPVAATEKGHAEPVTIKCINMAGRELLISYSISIN